MKDAYKFYQHALAANGERTSQFPNEKMLMAQAAMYGTGLDAEDQAKLIRLMIGSGDIGPLNSVVVTEIQQRYKQWTPVFQNVMRRRLNIADLRDVANLTISGADQRMKKVLELEEYTQIRLVQDPEKIYNLGKWGHIVPISWETLVNDAIGIMQQLPDMLLDGMMKTLEGFLCSQFFTSTGPSTAFFTQQTGGAPAALPLTIENLRTACADMGSYTGPDSDPISVTPRHLVVPPALRIQAMEILNSINLNHVVPAPASGSGTVAAFGQRNVLADLNIQLHVSPWITNIVTTGTKGKTSWALFADPAEVPAGEVGFLKGFEYPEIIGPGQMPAYNTGTVLSDIYTYRIKHVFGATTLDKRAGWASYGQ